jgi:hypothetical protein
VGDQKLTDILAQLVRTNATTRLPNMQQVSGLSNSILSSVGPQTPYQSEPNKKKTGSPSFVNRALDIMSRPLYSVLTPIKHDFENPGEYEFFKPKNWLAGLEGKEKTTGRDILDASGASDVLPGPAKFAAGLGIDIIADPLSYVGGLGLVGKIGKLAKGSSEALGAVEHGTASTAKNLTEEISERAAALAQKHDIVIPKAGEAAPALGSPPRTFVAGPGPEGGLENFAKEASKVDEAPRMNLGADLDEPTLKLDLRQSSPMRALPAAPVAEGPDILDELSKNLLKSKAGKSELPGLIAKLPDRAEPALALKVLSERIASTKSPVIQNLLKKEAQKIQAGIKPADILSEARVSPPPFPALTINDRWIQTAKEAAQSFLMNNRIKNINHVGQTNLYNKILHAASKVRKDRRPFHVLQMLRIAEDEVVNAGRHLTDAEGISVRLSDIANMSGGPRSLSPKLVDDFRKARPSQQVEDLKAFTTPVVASKIIDPVVKTAADVKEAAKELPPSQTVMIGSALSKELRKIAEGAGASSREAKTAKAYIDDLFNPIADKLHSAIHQEARNLVRQSSTGILNPTTMHKISEATYEALGANPKVLGRQLEQSKVVEGVMTKFATWWGAKDLKPFAREYIDTARNVAAAFAETMTPLVRATKPSQRFAAFAVAQGKRAASSPEEEALANQFKYLIERLMGTHGITENAEAVVLRSGTVLKELNDALPKSLEFVNTKGHDTLGRAFDYTNNNWMHSWKEWDIKEPAESLYELTRGLQLVTRKNAMWDDAAVRWGMPIKGAEFQHAAEGIDRLKGTHFPKEIATQLTNLKKQMDRDVFRTPHKSIALFDKVQRMWKTGVTIYSPAHHIRNLNGDVYLAALDGVVSPRPYALAAKILHAYPTRYRDLESVFKIMDPNLRESALRARPGNIVLTTKRGDKLTAEQIMQAAESQGIFPRAMSIEDLVGEVSPAMGTFGNKLRPFGGKVYDTATRVAELREHWVRLAHFADVLTKSSSPLKSAIEQAGIRVKKFHPDGSDMTGMEQNVLRRVIPFYSWMRKATPLVIEGAIMRPHITMAFPKAMANIQYATGIESNGPGDPFPMDQMFPEWLKEKGIGPILGPGSGLGRDSNWRGSAPGDTIVNPSSPFLDQLGQLGNPAKTLLSSLTPAAKIPIELLTGQSSLGIPLENSEGGVPGYLAQQIPAVGIGARLTGLTRDNEPYNPEQLINYVTGAGVTGTGPYQGQAQTELRDKLAQIAKKNRGDYR